MAKIKRHVLKVNLTDKPDTFIHLTIGTTQEQTALAELLSNEGLLESMSDAIKGPLSEVLSVRQSRARSLLQNASQKRERPGLGNVLAPFSAPQLNGSASGEN